MKYIYTKKKVLFKSDINVVHYEEGLSLFFVSDNAFGRFVDALKDAEKNFDLDILRRYPYEDVNIFCNSNGWFLTLDDDEEIQLYLYGDDLSTL